MLKARAEVYSAFSGVPVEKIFAARTREFLHSELAFVSNGSLLDLAGGYGAFSAIMARLGMQVTVVDTFAHGKHYVEQPEIRSFVESFGVKTIQADLTTFDPRDHFPVASLDVVTFFGAIFLFHPLALLERSVECLKPGGKLIVDFNNAASFSRRLKTLAGQNPSGNLHEYLFDGVHKRPWTATEVEALAGHLKLSEFSIRGTNWGFHVNSKNVPAFARNTVDDALRLCPSLCNDLYLIGKK